MTVTRLNDAIILVREMVKQRWEPMGIISPGAPGMYEQQFLDTMGKYGDHVITTVPSIYASFKLDSPGPPLGSIEQDRFGAIYGVVGKKAPMVPVHIQLATTLNKLESYEFEMVEDPFLTPALMNIGLVSALASKERMIGPSTFQIQGGIELANGDKVDVDDVVSGDANAGAMAGGAAATLSGLGLGRSARGARNDGNKNPFSSSSVSCSVRCQPASRCKSFRAAGADRESCRTRAM